jgi:WS/DGAT/MGAT family acyltransferase
VSEQDSRHPGRDHDPVRRLTGQDAIFVYGETRSMPMHTIGTMLIDPSDVPGGFGFDRVLETIESRIHLIPPFRQRLVEVPLALGHPLLVDDPEFRVENHVHRLAVPAPGTLRELAGIVGELAGHPLDRSQPLWEMWVIEGLQEGRIALVTKLHHCIIDGASGASQMAGLMDLERDAKPSPPRRPWRPAPIPSALELMSRSVTSRLVNPFELGRLAARTVQGLRSRRRAQLDTVREGEEAPPLFDTNAPATPFDRALSHRRVVAYGGASLSHVKQIKNAFGVTVNDVVLAACSLALRRYLEAHDALPDAPLVCLVPVSTKSASEREDLGNKVSMMAVDLPTHLEDPADMVMAVRRSSDDAKRVFGAIEHDLLPGWLQYMPLLLTRMSARLLSELKFAERIGTPGANLIVSNMRGPSMPLYFGGARVEAVYPMGPVGEGFGLNITVLSDMDRLDVGILSCPEIVPDVWEIADGFAQAVDELRIVAEKREALRGA